MSGPGRRFDPSELRTPGEPGPSVAESADALAVARELEALAAAEGIRPTEGFADRIMSAIATEPAPRLVVRPRTAIRGGRPAALIVALRDAWGVAMSGGRPMAVRAQALAFVLLVVVAAGSLTGVAALGAAGFFQSHPSPSVVPAPTATPTPTPSPSGPVTPSPSASPESTTGPGGPTETAEPGGTPHETGTAKPTDTPERETAHPTKTPKPGETAKPTETPEASDDHGGGHGGGGSDDPGGGGGGG